MAGSSGDSVTRRSVASQFFTQEEGPGIDGMTTSERVSVERWARGGEAQPLSWGVAPLGRVPAGLGWPGWRRHLPPLHAGGGPPEPGSADHQRFEDHSTQTGEGGGGVLGRAAQGSGLVATCGKEDAGVAPVSTVRH